MHELPRVVANTPVGKQVKIDFLRQGKTSSVTITITALKEDTPESPSEAARQLGMEVEELTPEMSQSLGIRHLEGIVVATVDEAGPAAAAGIREGDVIIEVNRQRVRTKEEYTKALRKGAGNPLLLLISRGESTLYVALKQ
jgi:serine protease Do